ncbi:MAG: BMP family ABC transporter substrate-binding protein [Anaerolineaceae bacterium]|nr:BMP family ABC transporter substrate-binding protein [Anaerolineaceae bacterium]
MRRKSWLVLSIVIIAMMVLVSCKPAEVAPEPVVEEAEEVMEEVTTAAIIMPNPLGDRSFIDSSARGIARANEELAVKADIIETQGVAEHEAALRGAIAQGYDLIMGLAIDSELLFTLCDEYPEQYFASPSEVFAETLPENLVAFTINVHESSYLVGLIVGSMTETKTVGAVMGGDAPGLNQFFYGYKQGVLEVCPDCTVLASYLGFDFSNPTLGKETAAAQYDEGADIIYQVAGRSGEGVIAASQERGLYSIGVDSNQDDIAAGSVIVSMIKRVDTTTFESIKMVVDGTYAGGFKELGLADGAAALSWDEGSTTFKDNGPAEMVEKLDAVETLVEEYRGKILSGDIVVCDALRDVEMTTEACAALK